MSDLETRDRGQKRRANRNRHRPRDKSNAPRKPTKKWNDHPATETDWIDSEYPTIDTDGNDGKFEVVYRKTEATR